MNCLPWTSRCLISSKLGTLRIVLIITDTQSCKYDTTLIGLATIQSKLVFPACPSLRLGFGFAWCGGLLVSGCVSVALIHLSHI